MVVRHVSRRKRLRDEASIGQVLSLMTIAGFGALLSNMRFFRVTVVHLGYRQVESRKSVRGSLRPPNPQPRFL